MLNALNTVFHGVVRISNKVNETEVLTRRRRKRTVVTPVRSAMTHGSAICSVERSLPIPETRLPLGM